MAHRHRQGHHFPCHSILLGRRAPPVSRLLHQQKGKRTAAAKVAKCRSQGAWEAWPALATTTQRLRRRLLAPLGKQGEAHDSTCGRDLLDLPLNLAAPVQLRMPPSHPGHRCMSPFSSAVGNVPSIPICANLQGVLLQPMNCAPHAGRCSLRQRTSCCTRQRAIAQGPMETTRSHRRLMSATTACELQANQRDLLPRCNCAWPRSRATHAQRSSGRQYVPYAAGGRSRRLAYAARERSSRAVVAAAAKPR